MNLGACAWPTRLAAPQHARHRSPALAMSLQLLAHFAYDAPNSMTMATEPRSVMMSLDAVRDITLVSTSPRSDGWDRNHIIACDFCFLLHSPG